MSMLVFLIGMGIAIAVGWLAIILVEGKNPVLESMERCAWAAIVGPTFLTFFFFVLYSADIILLTRSSLLLSVILLLFIQIGLAWYRNLFAVHTHPRFHGGFHFPTKKSVKIAILVLILWSLLKVTAGSINLVTTPTYWDDAFNNWNMRAKVFVQTQEIALELPGGNDITVTKEGVNSYPPSVPLLKAWLVILRGQWSEGLVNAVHAVWYIALLVVFFFFLRRKRTMTVAIIGTCGLVSLPLLLIQGLNPYADVYVAGHLLMSVGALWMAAEEGDGAKIRTWLLLSACVMAAAVFTKNEVLLVYLPVYALLFIWTLFLHLRGSTLSMQEIIRSCGMFFLIAVMLIAPWLWFKWINGLTFGNAKSVSEMTVGITLQTYAALHAIWYFLTREANFLFLPLTFALLSLASLKKLGTRPVGILALFVLLVVTGQSAIYLFTPLATEAVNQTGLGRGLVHIAPIAMLFVMIRSSALLEGMEDNY